MTLTQADIDAIADAVFQRIKADAVRLPEVSLVEETRAAMANGMDPLAFLKSRQNVARKPRRKSA